MHIPAQGAFSMNHVFFVLSKIISGLIFPLPLFFLATLLAGRGIKNRILRWTYAAIWISTIFLSIDAGSDFLMGSLEDRYPFTPAEKAAKADAIVVLGGMVNPLAPPTDRPEYLGSVDRILAGRDLIRLQRAPFLVVTGGSGLLGQQGKSEALILQDWLLKDGVSPEKLIIESKSRNTAENARFTRRMLKQNPDTRDGKKILLVTSAFHMHRSVLVFTKAGFEVIPFPVDYNTTIGTPFPEGYLPTPANLLHSTYAIKEYAGIVAYRLMGYL